MKLENIGTYEYDGKYLSCEFDVSTDDFFDLFPDIVGDTSSSVLDEVREAIEKNGKEVKIGLFNRGDVEEFFNKIELKLAQGEPDELFEGEAGEEPYDEAYETYDEKATEEETEAIEQTGISYDEENAEGQLVSIEIIESNKAEFEHNAETPKEETVNADGKLKIVNPSSKDMLWDMEVRLQHLKDIEWKSENVNFLEEDSLEEEESETSEEGEEKLASMAPIFLNNLNSNQEVVYEYSIKGQEDVSLRVDEFISTVNSEDTESYSLRANEPNTVLFKITAKNLSDTPLTDIVINKEIKESFSNVTILETQDEYGEQSEPENASVEAGEVSWVIESLDPETERELKITMDVDASDNAKSQSGIITAEYKSTKALSQMRLKDFKAYSSNFVGIEAEQNQEDPDAYTCSLMFENKSDFQMKLLSAEVFTDENLEENLVELGEETPIVSSGGIWKSQDWTSSTDTGMEPFFRKNVDFYVDAGQTITTASTITINDLELATAMVKGSVYFSVSELESYRETVFNALLEVENGGNANFNELIVEDTIQAGYIPPTPDQIEIYVVRPEGEEPVIEAESDEEIEAEGEELEEEPDEEIEAEGEELEEEPDEEIEAEGEELEEEVEKALEPGESAVDEGSVKVDETNEIDWDNLGERVEIDPSLIEITPDNQNPDEEHTVRVNLESLKDTNVGQLTPNMIFRVKYPILAYKPAEGTEYLPNIKFTANTLPAGKPIEVIPEAEEIEIPVIHIRKRIVRGKTIKAMSQPDQFLITLSVNNKGTNALENVKVQDAVDPESFEDRNYSLEPAEIGEIGEKKRLIWNVENIEPGETFEITYEIEGKGDYRASKNQFSV